MLQHVSIEISPEEAERSLEFWRLVGFEQVPAPEALGDAFLWVERGGTQIHLILTEGATVPMLGHPAVVVDNFDATMAAVAEAGFEVAETRELWGARRAATTAPGGHRVELMDSPPPATI